MGFCFHHMLVHYVRRLCHLSFVILVITITLQQGGGTAERTRTESSRSTASVANLSKVDSLVKTTDSPQYTSTPFPLQPIVYAADEKLRVSKPQIRYEYVIEQYKQTVKNQHRLTPTSAQKSPAKRPKPPIRQECLPCTVSRFFTRRTASCQPTRRFVAVSIGFCTQRFSTILCYGECVSYSETHLQRVASTTKIYEVAHVCRSCRSVGEVEYKLEEVRCSGYSKYKVKIPIERKCSCRPCSLSSFV
ncbi:uncharacterized protein LOC134187047 [Corticium candelabrum]|uniref:uncharacterized protein LOC134187047 n=1 Tax=Corticium candelabrum TaxID=121492 RepID=UPI002E25F1CE|nr:uncharacterized protein LOC134187047 [Corticium candelabrum]